jgi:uncharacterized damage-inducible protein DinB
MEMKRCLAMAACCAMLALPLSMRAQDKPKMAVEGTAIAPGDSLVAAMGIVEEEVIGAADAMPADKYNFVPSVPGGDFKDVRSFGSQVKHVAQSNYEFFKGFGVPGEIDPKTLESLQSKDDIMKALRDSYKYVNAALASITPQNAFLALKAPEAYKITRVSMAGFGMEHSMDHYGQMVVYLRMNGIIPPASRKSM